MRTCLPIATSCLLLLGSGASGFGQGTPGEAPAWVGELRTFWVDWDRAAIQWTVPWGVNSIPGFGPQPAAVTVVLESRQTADGAWTELGRFPLRSGDHTNRTPRPDPPAILLPERIFAPPPSSSYGSVSVNAGGGYFTLALATYTDHRLEPDTDYQYRMKAVNAFGEAPYSPVLTLRTSPLPPPQIPAESFVANVAGTGLEVLWTRSTLASEFLVERTREDGIWQQVAIVEGTLHSWTDFGVIPAKVYRYRVRARNGSGTSHPGAESSAMAYRMRRVFDAPAGGELSAPWQQRSGVVLAPDREESAQNALWFSGAGARSLTTSPLVFLIGGFLEFDFWSDQYYHDPEQKIVIQATLNGNGWTDVGVIYPQDNRLRWRPLSIELPPSWSSPSVQFRFLHVGSHEAGALTWAIRNIRVLAIQGNESAAPKIHIHEPLDRRTTQSRRSIKLAGTALDNHRLLGWAWSLNRGPWETSRLKPAKRASWNRTIRHLERGRNLIEVRAYDASGNLSASKVKLVRVR